MENLNWFTVTLLVILMVLVYRGLHFLYWLFFEGNIQLLFNDPSPQELQLITEDQAKRQADKEVSLAKKRKAKAISIENEKKRKKHEAAEADLRLRNEQARYQRQFQQNSYFQGK